MATVYVTLVGQPMDIFRLNEHLKYHTKPEGFQEVTDKMMEVVDKKANIFKAKFQVVI